VLLVSLAGYAAGALAQEPERSFYFRADTGHAWANASGYHDRQFSNPGPLGYLICDSPACLTQMSIDHLGQSTIYGLGAGWRFNPQWRADLTVSWRKFAVNGMDRFPENVHADVNSQVTMLTGYWDVPVDWKLKPYVGAGVGMARNSTGITTDTFLLFPGTIQASSGVKSSTAFSLSAGVGYAVYPGVVVEVGYRYFDLGKFQSGNNVFAAGGLSLQYPGAQGEMRTNEITLGVRF
jgi:opacity protein-like surface antigen